MFNLAREIQEYGLALVVRRTKLGLARSRRQSFTDIAGYAAPSPKLVSIVSLPVARWLLEVRCNEVLRKSRLLNTISTRANATPTVTFSRGV
jgi:hypothetical protein